MCELPVLSPRDGYCTLRDCETGWNSCCSDFEED